MLILLVWGDQVVRLWWGWIQLWDKVKALALLGKWLLDETDPSKPDGKQVINTKIIINAVEGGKQKSKILLNGKSLEKREDTVSK